MKISFCFLCRTNLFYESIWKKYFEHEENCNIYIHPDIGQGSQDEFFKKHEIVNRCPKDKDHTIMSRIELLKEAIKDKNNCMFVFLPEDSVPIQSFKSLYDYLKDKLEYSHCHYYEMDKSGINRGVGFTHKNGAWHIINRKHADLILEKKDDVNRFAAGIVGDESCLSSILYKYNMIDEIFINNGKTGHPYQIVFEDWVGYEGYQDTLCCKVSNHNFFYLENNYDKWVRENVFFYRKIINPADKILNFLSQKIKNNE